MNIYVSNLSYNSTEESLQELFSKFGTVNSAKIIKDRFTGLGRGFAFVEMASSDEGNNAISGLNGKEVEGRLMQVSVAKEKSKRDNNGW